MASIAERVEALKRAANDAWSISCIDDLHPEAGALLGSRLIVEPKSFNSRHRIAVVSSRISRSFDHWTNWFRALRYVVSQADDQHDLLVISPGTSTERFVRRAAELFGKPWIALDIHSNQESLDAWMDRALAEIALPPNRSAAKLLISPLLDEEAGKAANEFGEIPLRDRAPFAISPHLVALHVRNRSVTQQLVEHRLVMQSKEQWLAAADSADADAPRKTLVAIGEQLVSATLRDALLDHGAIGLALVSVAVRAHPPATANSIDELSIESFVGENGQWDYLTHCTRRRNGPWPLQTQREFLDDMVLDRQTAPRSALDSLRYILQSNRLVASSESVRGTEEVVCFTAVPLWELQKLRVFRPHRGRWDFEPYGVCIDRDYLAATGARPVTYVDANASVAPNAMVQRAVSMTKSGAAWDWTVEREWRHLGDLALDKIPEDAAFVFVPTPEEAQLLRQISPWPVVVLRIDG